MRPHLEHAIAHLVERERLALSSIAEAFHIDDPRLRESADLQALVDLGTRLPSGLVHAESIWLLPEPPDAEPLGPHSPWFVLDRSLASVIAPGKRTLHRLLRDLAVYYFAAGRIKERLEARHDLVDLLNTDALVPTASTELALILDASPSLVASLDRSAPGLRRDVASMAQWRFDPELRLHASLHPARQRALGEEMAGALLAKLPHGPVRVIVADTHAVLEHLSPYVRDLGFALTAWGLENPEHLRTEGLLDALGEHRDRPNLDLAALVVPDLMARAPDLLDERRTQEQAAGLFVEDRQGMAHGWAELSRLALPDDLAVGKDASGLVAVLSGGSDDALHEAARCLLDSGRVSAMSVIAASAIDSGEPLIPDALALEDDGIPIPLAAEVVDRAHRLGLSVHRGGCIPVDEASGAPAVASDVLRAVRRARVLGRISEEAPVFLVLYPSPRSGAGAGLHHRLSEVEAGRIALSFLSSPEDSHGAPRPRRGLSQNAPGVSRRFRA